MVKRNVHQSSLGERQTCKDDVCRENSLKESCCKYDLVKLIHLQTKSDCYLQWISPNFWQIVSKLSSFEIPEVHQKLGKFIT